MNFDLLAEAAKEAMTKAYAPYSGYFVGAALLAKDGKVYTGCNVENSAYSATNCAERTAFFRAIADGKRDFRAIAIAGGSENSESSCPPCGVCRQVMMEFCDPHTFKIILVRDGGFEEKTLAELLPLGFDNAKK